MSYTLAYQGAEIDDILGRAAPGGALDTAIAAKQDALTFDAVPTQGSTNPAESGGIYDAIQAGGATALAAFPTDSVSGDVVSFADGADGIPVKSFTGSIIPQQNLNGQSAPYPAGGGKNKFQTTASTTTNAGVLFTVNDDGTIKPTRTGSSTANASLLLGIVTLPVGSYLVNGGSSVNNAYMTLRDNATDAFIANIVHSDYALTVTEEKAYKLVAVVPSNSTPTATLYPMIRLATEADATFAPYSNICPISGWTGANVYRTGVNLCNPATITDGHRVSNNGNLIVGATAAVTDYIPIKGNTSYYLRNTLGGSSFYSSAVYDANKTFIKNISVLGSGASSGAITTPADARFIRVNMPLASKADFAVNFPSTDHDYHAYNGSTILLSFGQTVYAGTLTALGGGLWQVQPTHEKLEVPKTGWVYANGVFYLNNVLPSGYTKLSDATWLCNAFAPAVAAWDTTTAGNQWADNSIGNQNSASYYRRLMVKATTYGTDAAAFMAGLPSEFYILYALTTLPDPIIVTASDLQTLLGANTVWTDVGAVTGMTYRADTALYIQKLLNGGTLSTLSIASPSPSLSLGRVGVLAEPEEAEPEQTEEESEQLEQTEEA